MKFSIWMDPWANVAGCSLDPVAPGKQPRWVFSSEFDRQSARENLDLRREDHDPDDGFSFHNGDACVEVGTYLLLDESPSALRNALTALLIAFDTNRSLQHRNTSMFLGPFRDLVDAMLAFDDDPDAFVRQAVSDHPLPDLVLLLGANTASRYDFWEAR